MRLSRVACLSAMALCLSGGSLLQAQGLSLSQALQIALQEHPALRIADSGRRVAEASLAEASAGRLPVAHLTERIARGNNPVYAFGSLLEQGRFGPENFSLSALNSPESVSNFRTELNIRLPLFDRKETGARIRQAEIGIEQMDLQREAIEQQVRFDVIRSYYGLILALARSDLADTAVRMADEDLRRAEDMKEAGLVVESDRLAAAVQRAEFRQQQIQAVADVAAALAGLNVAMGRDVDVAANVDASMPERSFALAPQSESIALALARRPDFLRAAAAIRSAGEGLTSARGQSLPRIDVFGTYGMSGSGFASGSADYSAGATVSIDLFDAGRSARIARASAQRAVASAELEELANRIRLEVVRAHQNQIASEERLAVARASAAQAEEVHRVVQDRYQAGLSDIMNVLHAQTALVRARTNLVAARYEQHVGYAAVLLETGGLTDGSVFEERGAN